MGDFLEKFWDGSKFWFKLLAVVILICIVFIAMNSMTQDKVGLTRVFIALVVVWITAMISWVLLGIAITSGIRCAKGDQAAAISAGLYILLSYVSLSINAS